MLNKITIVLCSALALASFGSSHDLGEHGKNLEVFLNRNCASDANDRCDSYPVEECKDTFEDLCEDCFESVEDGEAPSKQCLVDCALINREELVAQNCTASVERKIRKDRGRYASFGKKSRGRQCTSAILEVCPAECEGLDDRTIDKTQRQTCWDCVEEKYEDIKELAEEDESCGHPNHAAECADAIPVVCTECFSNGTVVDIGDEEQVSCLEECFDEKKDELKENGCKRGVGKHLFLPESAECRAKVAEVCGPCIDEDEDGIPTKECMVDCLLTNKEELVEAGCSGRIHAVRQNVKGFLSRFKRVYQCFRDDLPGLSPNCTEAIADVDGEPDLTTDDVDALFLDAIAETESEVEAAKMEGVWKYAAIGSGVAVAVVGSAVVVYRKRTIRGKEEPLPVAKDWKSDSDADSDWRTDSDSKLVANNPQFDPNDL